MVGIMVQTLVLVVAVLVVQKIFAEKLHAYVRYGLWLLVVFRLFMPINLIDSPFSVLRIVETVAVRYEEKTDNDNAAAISRLAGSRNDTVSQAANDNVQAEGAGQAANNAHSSIEQSNSNMQISSSELAGNNMPSDNEGQIGNNMQIGSAELTGNNMMTNNEERTSDNIQIGNAEPTNDIVRNMNGYGTDHDWQVSFIERVTDTLHIESVAQAVWLIGSLTVGSFLAISHSRFRRRLRRTRTVYQGSVTDAAQKKRVPVYRVKGLESPCLVGFFRPAVYIGADIDTDSDIFRYAVTHEKVHYLHKDHIWAFVRAVLVVIYWFHPFVWIAAAASAKDGEIACDYGTVRKIGQEELFAYGEMLLSFSRSKSGKRVYSYGTMLRPDRSGLKERILRLTQTKSSKVWAGILTAVFMVVLAGCAFTGAAAEDSTNRGNDGALNIVLKNPASEENGDNDDSLSENNQSGKNNKNKENNEKDINNENVEDNKGEDQTETVTEPRQLEAVSADISAETPFGADGPTLDYAGNSETGNGSIIIFHDYFGLIVYDLMDQKIIRSLDLAAIGCNMTQGDDACQVAVSADGAVVWLHPMSKPYKYRYDADKDLLYQEPLVKTFSTDLEGEDLFDRYMVTEEPAQQYEGLGWHSNYLYEEYKDELGMHSAYIYLCVSDSEEQKLGSLQCTWDDMVFILQWNSGDVSEGQSTESGDFPYSYDGIVQEVEIIYDKPCNYLSIANTFGGRVHPVTQEVMMHEGIDYVAEAGTDVAAAADGVVYETGFSEQYGNYVVLLHINGEMTYYCQCQEVIVKKDAQVKRGEKIATVGSTGMSTGSHLHFALSRAGYYVDPEEHMRTMMEVD